MDFRNNPIPIDNSDTLSQASTEAEISSQFSLLSLETVEQIQARVNLAFEERKQQLAERNQESAERKKKQEEFRQSIRETIRRNEEVLAKTQNTIKNLQSTIQGCKETEQKFQDFKDTFQRVLDSALSGFASAMGVEDKEEMKQKFGVPEIGDYGKVSQALLNSKNITFILGAGLSAESGIRTYKGNSQTFLVNGRELQYQEVVNGNFLKQNPLFCLQANQQFRKSILPCHPNVGHFALADIYSLLKNRGIRVNILTQNVDNFDRQVLGDTEDLYELHGNFEYMRCLNQCTNQKWASIPADQDLTEIPQCVNCGGPARFHVLLFEESYNEEFYRSKSAIAAAQESDVYIVVGSQLKITLPQQVVQRGVKEGKLVVEVNIDPVIEYGNVSVFQGTSGSVLPELLRNLQQQSQRT